jgi:hypothetical protein
MNDLDTALTDALERLASTYSSNLSPEQVIGELRRSEPPASRFPARGALAVAAAVALVAVLAAAVVRRVPDSQLQTVPAADPADSAMSRPAPTPTTVTTLPAVQARRGGRPVIAVAGDRYLVWGGEDGTTTEMDRNDGFTVDLVTGGVEAIPPAPIAPSYNSVGGWTGSELIVWSAECPACGPEPHHPGAAAWNPDTKSWRTITAPPAQLASGQQTVVATGTQIITVTNKGIAASYDPATDRWDSLPPVPGDTSFNTSLVWTGSQVIYWATSYYGGPFPAPRGGPLADRGWQWTPGASTWAPLPDLPEGYRTSVGSIAWTGAEIVAWGEVSGGTGSEAVGAGATWRPGDPAWTPLPLSPQSPARRFEGTAGSQKLLADPATGTIFVVPLRIGDAPPTALLYDSKAHTWTNTGVTADYSEPRVDITRGIVLVPDPMSPIAARLQLKPNR